MGALLGLDSGPRRISPPSVPCSASSLDFLAERPQRPPRSPILADRDPLFLTRPVRPAEGGVAGGEAAIFRDHVAMLAGEIEVVGVAERGEQQQRAFLVG